MHQHFLIVLLLTVCYGKPVPKLTFSPLSNALGEKDEILQPQISSARMEPIKLMRTLEVDDDTDPFEESGENKFESSTTPSGTEVFTPSNAPLLFEFMNPEKWSNEDIEGYGDPFEVPARD